MPSLLVSAFKNAPPEEEELEYYEGPLKHRVQFCVSVSISPRICNVGTINVLFNVVPLVMQGKATL